MKRFAIAALFLVGAVCLHAADYPQPTPGDFVLKDFKFASGETLPELRIHYRTLGTPQKDAHGRVRNAVLVLHGTTGSGENFLSASFAGVLFSPGGLLDARTYYVVIPDGIGHGQSSKPSDGLHARFPRYGYDDMVTAQYRLLTEGLGVDHLRLVMGTSMGGMHTWVWGEKYPDFMDALLPLASLPVQIAGRNRAWRKMAVDAIRNDPGFNHGDYTAQPYGLTFAIDLLWLMSSSPVQRQKDSPTREQADAAVDQFVAGLMKSHDANDVAYAIDASWDYNPEPKLSTIQAPLLAINFADDLINPPELGILERAIKRVSHGRAVLIPAGPATRGHGTHSLPAVYQQHLAAFLKETTK
ncbi:MAG TPA: alpha/beta fold hydrolase [Terriglobales bacterium]|nr:alpha/beta fold hydrolase [Terriglobales bacterium]